MKRTVIIALGFVALSAVSEACARQFAAEVVSYEPGTGFATEWNTGVGFTNKDAIIGAPARVTPGEWGGPITPFSPPYLPEQILSVGQGGEVTLKFAEPIRDERLNPFGLDFIVFGSAGFTITNGDFSGDGITDGTLFGQADGETRVSVSVDGDTWFTLNPEQAPMLDTYCPTDGSGDFGLPINPALGMADFVGGGLSRFAELYAGSGGGTGYDIAWAVDVDHNPVMLGQVQFLRLEVLSGKAEIDAVSDVRPQTKNLDWHFEDFMADPLANGWAVHGDESLFKWDAESDTMEVTWDSEKPNSYFYRPLGLTLTEDDAFAFTFDIVLDQVKAGHLDGQPYTFEVALGLLNIESARANEFNRGSGTDSPNLLEWDYFPDTGFGATISPTIASATSQFAAGFTFPAAMTVRETYSVRMEFDPDERALKTFMLQNGKAWKEIETVTFNDGFDGFAVDAFSISSYTAKGSDSSLLATGWVDNLAVVVARSQSKIVSARLTDRQWAARSFGFDAVGSVLERSADLREWHPVGNGVYEEGFYLRLIDRNPPIGDVFYRLVR
ncbi:uncharacterized protein METZ01_LOCUS153980 [marine metagenome]|uniref:Uncharacterized protein n=1 Tax=marine metagenome TaxID=408172 RepID=A0A382AI03_9ZZZZ